MNWKIPVLSIVILLILSPLSAKSSFALYFNSSKTRIRTVIVYNETGDSLSIGRNGGMDWAGGGEGEPSSLPPGDLTSFRAGFMTGDCILIESEDDGVFLAISSDRDSVYVYAREDQTVAAGEARPVREE
ncbi:MAG: hypothetical protein ILP18_10960 [Treponema sp.]|nr:hypothetical protein [Treponema sp.]